MTNEANDVELLNAWVGGDRSAGNQLFVRYFTQVFRFFRFKVGPAADELTQKTFLGVLENAANVDASRGLRGYLFGVARNQLLMHLRTTRREAARFDPGSWSLADAGLEAPKLLARHREQEVLAAALAQLPFDYQCALELHYWEGLDVAEIAVALAAPEGTIKARLSRGRKLLRVALEAQWRSEPELLQSVVGDLDRWLRALPDLVHRGSNAQRDRE